jgi:hypothetical protein
MTIRYLFFSMMASGALCMALSGVSSATVPRAFVSVSGSDLNPCSAVQPCRSFNQALAAVQPGGEIVVKDSGGYSTGFTISQSVTIDAAGFNASLISIAPGDLCTINAGPNDRVVLRGISFHGAHVGTNAINVTQVGNLYVEHCSIGEFTGSGVNMPNGGNLFVTSTDVRACAKAIDLETSGASPAVLVGHDSRFTECFNGVLVRSLGTGTASGYLSDCTASLCDFGFEAAAISGGAGLLLTNCRAVGLETTGIDAEGSAFIQIVNCVLVGCGIRRSFNAFVVGTTPGTNFSISDSPNNSFPTLK